MDGGKNMTVIVNGNKTTPRGYNGTGNPHFYGISLDDEFIYVSDWDRKQVKYYNYISVLCFTRFIHKQTRIHRRVYVFVCDCLCVFLCVCVCVKQCLLKSFRVLFLPGTNENMESVIEINTHTHRHTCNKQVLINLKQIIIQNPESTTYSKPPLCYRMYSDLRYHNNSVQDCNKRYNLLCIKSVQRSWHMN